MLQRLVLATLGVVIAVTVSWWSTGQKAGISATAITSASQSMVRFQVASPAIPHDQRAGEVTGGAGYGEGFLLLTSGHTQRRPARRPPAEAGDRTTPALDPAQPRQPEPMVVDQGPPPVMTPTDR